MIPRTCSFDVIGIPAPQGSKRHVGHGIMIESSNKVKPWRAAVMAASTAAMRAQGITAPLDGPLHATIIFVFRRPKTAPKSRSYPDVSPDIDKLLRSTLDALTQSGLIADDARIVCVHASKIYWRTSATHLMPGANILIGEIDP